MAFCIECGAKAPDVAKFCPQCGAALVEIEPVVKSAPAAAPVTPTVETVEADTIETPEILDTEPEEIVADTTEIETMAADPVDAAPSAAASIAAAANLTDEEPKSKAGLLIGLGLIALIAAGGGAYALGLFGGDDDTAKSAATAPVIDEAEPLAEPEMVEIDTPDTDPVLTAYQDAIKTGRISDLGKFATANPESGLAKDAEAAAFASLKRQNSVLAYTVFTEYFPDADTSSYIGPRENSGESAEEVEQVDIEMFNTPEPAPAPQTVTPSIVRSSITQRAEELDAFIAQGDADYALLVIDEMLGMSDLNDAEATYLLNLRARAETSRGLIAPSAPTPIEPIVVQPAASTEITPAPESAAPTPEPAAPSADAAEALDPNRPYDTPAKAIERFGGITPDAATEPGSCDMAFSVSTTGTPTNIIASCTNPIFTQPAKDAVTEWVYSPAMLNGAPVQQNGVVVTIRFNLE